MSATTSVITPGAAGTTGTSGQTQTRSATTGLGTDFNTFLTLLTTQLRNQDPTNAMDVNKMTEQLVAFTAVEQQVQTNTNLAQLITLQQGNTLTSASDLLGRVVEVESNRMALQNSQAALRLPAAGAARQAVIQITDSSGRVVREAQAPLTSGSPSTWNWDGRDGAGRQLADGSYGFTIQGRDAGGGRVAINAGVLARPTGVERANGGVNIRFGNLALPYDSLRSVQP